MWHPSCGFMGNMGTEHEMTPAEMWKAYLATLGETPEETSKTYTAWHFCYEVEDADALAALVKAGQKRATAGALPVYQQHGEPVPNPGDLSVILDGHGVAQCVIQTTQVEILPFEAVPESFAWREGEGDRSLAYWRTCHERFFRQELEDIGLRMSPDLPVVCECFEVVYLPDHS